MFNIVALFTGYYMYITMDTVCIDSIRADGQILLGFARRWLYTNKFLVKLKYTKKNNNNEIEVYINKFVFDRVDEKNELIVM